MRTDSVERVKRSADIEQGHDLVIGQNLFGCSRRNITHGGDSNRLGHAKFFVG
jgi:hypothetical protein